MITIKLSGKMIEINTTEKMLNSIEELRKGYDIITGCDNSELTDEHIKEYMKDILSEE